jgi:hypothetical protein
MKSLFGACAFLVVSCAPPAVDSESAAAYSVSLALLDASAAVLLQDPASLKPLLADAFTINRRPWTPETASQALQRAVVRIRVHEAHFLSREGKRIDVPLTYVEPDAELLRVFRRQHPHEEVRADLSSLQKVGIRGGWVHGSARCLLTSGSSVDVDFTLSLEPRDDRLVIRSLDFRPRD